MGYRHYFYSVEKNKKIHKKRLEELIKIYGEHDGENTDLYLITLTDAFDLLFEFGKYWNVSLEMEKSCTNYFKNVLAHDYFNNREKRVLKANNKTIQIAIDYFKTWKNEEGTQAVVELQNLKDTFDFKNKDLIFSAY